MEKWFRNANSFIFDWIITKVTGNKDRHTSSVEFDIWPNQTTHFGVTCLRVTKISHFWTWISLKPVGQSWSNFMCSIIRVGFYRRLDQNSGSYGNRKPLLTYNGENDVSTSSRLFLILSFLYLQVTKTCIKSRKSSNFGQIGLALILIVNSEIICNRLVKIM